MREDIFSLGETMICHRQNGPRWVSSWLEGGSSCRALQEGRLPNGTKLMTEPMLFWHHWTAVALSNFISFNTLRLRQNGHHFPDYIFKWIFLNENVWISINISLKFVPRGPINNIPTLVQVMAWCRPGNKPLSDPIMVRLPTHICITRPQWVKRHVQNKSHYITFVANTLQGLLSWKQLDPRDLIPMVIIPDHVMTWNKV